MKAALRVPTTIPPRSISFLPTDSKLVAMDLSRISSIMLRARGRMKMGLRWWRDVLIRNQTKRYLDDRQARKYWFVSFGKTR